MQLKLCPVSLANWPPLRWLSRFLFTTIEFWRRIWPSPFLSIPVRTYVGEPDDAFMPTRTDWAIATHLFSCSLVDVSINMILSVSYYDENNFLLPHLSASHALITHSFLSFGLISFCSRELTYGSVCPFWHFISLRLKSPEVFPSWTFNTHFYLLWFFYWFKSFALCAS